MNRFFLVALAMFTLLIVLCSTMDVKTLPIVINSDYHTAIAFSDNGTVVDKERVNKTVYISIDSVSKSFKIGDKIYTMTNGSNAYDPRGIPCKWNLTKKIFVLKYKYLSTVYHINYIQK